MVFHAFLNIVVDIETLELISWISMHTARGGREVLRGKKERDGRRKSKKTTLKNTKP